VGRANYFPASFSFIPSRSVHRRSLAARHPPPWTWCPGYHPKHSHMLLNSFAITLAKCRCNPCAKPWPGALFRPTPATPPPPGHTRVSPAVGCGVGGPDPLSPESKDSHTGQPSRFAKEPLGFFLTASLSFHLKETLQTDSFFYVLALVFIRFRTLGPAKPFYVLSLMFLYVISFMSSVSC
jgi:hypothetical protein